MSTAGVPGDEDVHTDMSTAGVPGDQEKRNHVRSMERYCLGTFQDKERP
jgi:hypothetical protein